MTGSALSPCFATTWGDQPLDREPGEHVWQLQPFWNQDWRRWCSRCGLLSATPSLSVSGQRTEDDKR